MIMIKKALSKKPMPLRTDGSSTPKQRLGTVREACEYGRFCHTKCYDYINAGAIDAYKRGKRTLIDLDSIDAMHASMPKIKPKAGL
jgi:hypothetical protein